MTAVHLNHVSVVAHDLQESIQFYEDVFGLERVATPNFGFPVQWLKVGVTQLHLFEQPGDSPVYHHIGLTVDDLESVYQTAQSRGLLDRETFGSHLRELPNGQVQLYVRDPAGNLIEVNCADAASLSPAIRSELTRLIDDVPQEEEHRGAALFLTPDSVTSS